MSVPKLRFKGFHGDWNTWNISEVLQRVSHPVDVEPNLSYREIGIRSHGKGIFHKEPVTGASLGDKRIFWVGENLFVLNIVFAWEQAVAMTTAKEKGMVASHRFPMYAPKSNLSVPDYILRFFLTAKGKHLLGLASPGGAGRNKTLGQKNFEELSLTLPSPVEQTKIADFLTAVDEKISQLTKKCDLLTQYKKGVMQKIFSQELRFKDDEVRDFPEWEEYTVGEVCECLDNRRKPLNDAERQTMKGDIPYWGANNIMDYVDDFIFDETIVLLAEDGGNFDEYATRPIANLSRGKCWVNNHTHVLRGGERISNEFLFYSLVHKNITGYVSGGTRSKLTKGEMLKIVIDTPSKSEQTKIANFLSAIDDKITATQNQLDAVKQYKQGLLQQMFV